MHCKRKNEVCLSDTTVSASLTSCISYMTPEELYVIYDTRLQCEIYYLNKQRLKCETLRLKCDRFLSAVDIYYLNSGAQVCSPVFSGTRGPGGVGDKRTLFCTLCMVNKNEYGLFIKM